MATVETLLTAEEYAKLSDIGQPTELVRGKVVRMNPPRPRHGKVCVKAARFLDVFAEEHDLGHVMCNDTGVVTERDPDTVRGADVSFYSYARLPKGPVPDDRYIEVAPNLVFEVRSPEDRWSKLLAKVSEYLEAGVTAVCVLDPQTQKAHVYYADRPVEVLSGDDELTFPEILGEEFRVPVRRFFE